MKKNILLSIVFALFTSGLIAQDSTSCNTDLSIGADIMSRYVWRGTDFGRSPSIQPAIEFSAGNFAIGAWGAYTTTGIQTQEADLYLGYNIGDAFSLCVTDYFFPNDTVADKYFNYDDNTGHILEATLAFNGTENIPISLLIATNVWGADAKKTNGDNYYSTYAELAYSTTIKGTDLSIFMGWNLIESGFYGNDIGIVNLGVSASKEIAVTDEFALPISCSLISNPQAENIFMVFGISF